MQFIPDIWALWGQDANGDGIRNPQNIFDATKSTVWYLCLGGPADLTNPDALAAPSCATTTMRSTWPPCSPRPRNT